MRDQGKGRGEVPAMLSLMNSGKILHLNLTTTKGMAGTGEMIYTIEEVLGTE